MIGNLQEKVRDIIPYVDYFHNFRFFESSQEIQKRADRTVKCFAGHISGEESKHGFSKKNY